MITSTECWALRAQIEELLMVVSMKKRPSARLINSLRVSEAVLAAALHNYWKQLLAEGSQGEKP